MLFVSPGVFHFPGSYEESPRHPCPSFCAFPRENRNEVVMKGPYALGCHEWRLEGGDGDGGKNGRGEKLKRCTTNSTGRRVDSGPSTITEFCGFCSRFFLVLADGVPLFGAGVGCTYGVIYRVAL